FPKTTAVKPDDPRIVKNYPNAFKKTNLDSLLKEKGINTVFLCGLSSTGCVLATYHGALELDYDMFMVKDALIGPDAAETRSVEGFCRTIDYWSLKLLLENICR
ncbi:MAG: isochorismatase family cysteine hydrolase, partial [Acidobacteriota bacterium]